jgi:multidrug efflux pump subunit AcrB
MNLLTIIVIALILVLGVIGAYRGLIRTALSLIAVVISVIVVYIISPMVGTYVINHTELDDKLYDSIFCANGYLKRGEGGKIPYWYAFLEPPNKNSYGRDDFIKVNKALFPNGASSLEVFEWSTDWSEYFSEGHEWWGTACYSVYDKVNKRFVVVLASATD